MQKWKSQTHLLPRWGTLLDKAKTGNGCVDSIVHCDKHKAVFKEHISKKAFVGTATLKIEATLHIRSKEWLTLQVYRAQGGPQSVASEQWQNKAMPVDQSRASLQHLVQECHQVACMLSRERKASSS